jgi:fructose-bisphosphate aldolase, class II
MTLVGTGTLVQRAIDRSSAVAAFNVITVEHAEAIVAGAERAQQGVILQISQNAVRFHRDQLRPIAAAAAAVADLARMDVSLHLDHVTDPDLLRQAADAGFSSVMFDAGAASYPDNVAATTAAVKWAHSVGLWVEAELGYVGGKPDAPAGAHAAGVRTDPDEAAAYVSATGVDALAVAVGSSHAMTSRTARIDHDLIRAIAAQVPVPLVLHGSSGVSPEDLSAAAAAGLRKINVGTALNVSFTGAIRGYLEQDAEVTDPRKYLAVGREAMAATVTDLIRAVTV